MSRRSASVLGAVLWPHAPSADAPINTKVMDEEDLRVLMPALRDVETGSYCSWAAGVVLRR
jgi:hypothetical protein